MMRLTPQPLARLPILGEGELLLCHSEARGISVFVIPRHEESLSCHSEARGISVFVIPRHEESLSLSFRGTRNLCLLVCGHRCINPRNDKLTKCLALTDAH